MSFKRAAGYGAPALRLAKAKEAATCWICGNEIRRGGEVAIVRETAEVGHADCYIPASIRKLRKRRAVARGWGREVPGGAPGLGRHR